MHANVPLFLAVHKPFSNKRLLVVYIPITTDTGTEHAHNHSHERKVLDVRLAILAGCSLSDPKPNVESPKKRFDRQRCINHCVAIHPFSKVAATSQPQFLRNDKGIPAVLQQHCNTETVVPDGMIGVGFYERGIVVKYEKMVSCGIPVWMIDYAVYRHEIK